MWKRSAFCFIWTLRFRFLSHRNSINLIHSVVFIDIGQKPVCILVYWTLYLKCSVNPIHLVQLGKKSSSDTLDKCGTECFHTALTKSNVSTTALYLLGFSVSPFKASQHKHSLFKALQQKHRREPWWVKSPCTNTEELSVKQQNHWQFLSGLW